MGFQKKIGKGRLDKYYHLAKEQGYRARSAFKLIQLHKKYNFLSNARCLVDLCAAPGGWLQVAAKYMPVPNLIIGLDLVSIKPIPNVMTFQQDITTEKCRARLREALKSWKVDVFLHDGAPNVGTAWVQDAYTQSELVLHALKLACEFLIQGGCFVTKVFRSKDYNNLIWVFQQLFKKVEATKPASSRNISAEIFVYCSGFLAPDRIDPKLLDPRHVFEELDLEEDAQKASKVDIFHPEKHQRKREGYTEGEISLHKSAHVMDFINSSDPVSILGNYNEIKWNGDDDSTLKAWPETNHEVLECLKDLKVLGRKDYKRLLKWRVDARKFLGSEKVEKKEVVQKDAESSEDTLDELERLNEEEQFKLKKGKKKQHKKKRKTIERMHIGMRAPSDIGIEQNENLFNIPEESAVTKINEDEIMEELSSSEDSEENFQVESGEESEIVEDSDEEIAKEVDTLDKSLELMYEHHQMKRTERKNKKVKPELKPKWKNSEEFVPFDQEEKKESSGSDSSSSYSSEEEEVEEDVEEAGDMSKKRQSPESSDGQLTKKAKLFFNQRIFKEFNLEDEDEVEGEENQKENGINETKLKPRKEDKASKKDNLDVEMKDVGNNEDIIEVPAEEEPMKKGLFSAEAITMAQALVRGRKSREDLIDEGFNRYTFHDEGVLPKWFLDDENQHNKPQRPVTKEAIKAMRERLNAINARPIKKIAEAKARKKQKAVKLMEKALKKQENVIGNDELTEKEKAKAVVSLKKKALSGMKKKREVKVVVARGVNRGNKGRPSGVKGRYKMVDSRMRKEVRAQKNKLKTLGRGKRKNGKK